MNLKNKIIILILILFVSIGLISFFIILPTIKDIREISSAIKREKEDLEIKYQKGQLIRKTTEDFEKAKPLGDKLLSIFIPANKELEFITTLEKISQEYGVKQKIDLKTEEIKEEKNIKILPLQLSLEGDFIQILKYLDKLNKLNYYFNVSTINFITNEKMTGEVKVIVKGKAYSK